MRKFWRKHVKSNVYLVFCSRQFADNFDVDFGLIIIGKSTLLSNRSVKLNFNLKINAVDTNFLKVCVKVGTRVSGHFSPPHA